MMQEISQQLALHLNKLDLSMPTSQQAKLIDFLQLLHKWNQRVNLTAITTYEEMLTKHLLDSLSVAPYIKGDFILDVGTGAGFPGLPLACYYPNKQFVLLDSNGKKVAFLQYVKAQLAITNIKVEQQRLENFSTTDEFDVIISRAVGKINELVEPMTRLLAPCGKIILMQGKLEEHELKGLGLPYDIVPLEVPGLFAERHLIVIKGV
jgi:16S rRNA (guanine527-N7)-methyltransferase